MKMWLIYELSYIDNQDSEKIILIPSRINSKRLPAKALLKIENIPLIIHTYKRACLSKLKDKFTFVQTQKK